VIKMGRIQKALRYGIESGVILAAGMFVYKILATRDVYTAVESAIAPFTWGTVGGSFAAYNMQE
jgi:hypothetical protein